MKPKVKYVLLIIVLVIVVAGIYAYLEYNRKPADLSGIQPTSRISADSLVSLFENDEAKANTLYLGKPIEVFGKIGEIVSQMDTIVNVSLGNKGTMHNVSCLMDVNHLDDIKLYKAGDDIVIRGICNGYLMDVELNRCVVIK